MLFWAEARKGGPVLDRHSWINLMDPPGSRPFLDCYWVGSLDVNFLVEIKLGFPLKPQKVKLWQEGQQRLRI